MCGMILKRDTKEERLRIIETTATIIREDIRSIPYDLEYFPPLISFRKLTQSTSQSDQIVFLKPGKGKMETKFYSIQTLKEQFKI
jgi:hypothetical protein